MASRLGRRRLRLQADGILQRVFARIDDGEQLPRRLLQPTRWVGARARLALCQDAESEFGHLAFSGGAPATRSLGSVRAVHGWGVPPHERRILLRRLVESPAGFVHP